MRVGTWQDGPSSGSPSAPARAGAGPGSTVHRHRREIFDDLGGRALIEAGALERLRDRWPDRRDRPSGSGSRGAFTSTLATRSPRFTISCVGHGARSPSARRRRRARCSPGAIRSVFAAGTTNVSSTVSPRRSAVSSAGAAGSADERRQRRALLAAARSQRRDDHAEPDRGTGTRARGPERSSVRRRHRMYRDRSSFFTMSASIRVDVGLVDDHVLVRAGRGPRTRSRRAASPSPCAAGARRCSRCARSRSSRSRRCGGSHRR